MNADRRKRIEEACNDIYRAIELLNEVKDEEQEAYDNLPEGIKDSDRGESMSENVSFLEDITSNLEDLEMSLEDFL